MALPPNRSTPNRGSGFTNLQRVIDANRQNRLGQAVSGGITKAGESARGELQKAGQEFQAQTGQERVRQAGEQDRVNRVLGGELSNIADEDVKAFEAIRGNQFLGPEGIKNIGEIRGQAESAEGLGRAVSTEGGRMGLLQRYASGNDKYTGGQQRLDSLLLGQTGTQQLRGARKAVAGLGNQAASRQYAASETAKELQSRAKGLGENTIQRIGEKITGYNTDLENKAKELQANAVNMRTQARKDLDEGIATEALINQLGLNEGARLYTTDFNPLLKDNPLQATKQIAQNQTDFNRFKNLGRLGGGSLQGDPSKFISEFSNEQDVDGFTKAGLFLDPNKGDISTSVANAENLYLGESAGARQGILDAYNFVNTADGGFYRPTDLSPIEAKVRELYGQGVRNDVINDALIKQLDEAPMMDQLLGQGGINSGGTTSGGANIARYQALDNAGLLANFSGGSNTNKMSQVFGDALYKTLRGVENTSQKPPAELQSVLSQLKQLAPDKFLPRNNFVHEVDFKNHEMNAYRAALDSLPISEKAKLAKSINLSGFDYDGLSKRMNPTGFTKEFYDKYFPSFVNNTEAETQEKLDIADRIDKTTLKPIKDKNRFSRVLKKKV